MDHKHFTTLLNQMEASTRNNGNESREPCTGGRSRKWKVFNASIDCLVQTLIGGSVLVTLWFALSKPVSAFQLHVGLSVVGYQLLIAHGILSLYSHTWSFLSLQQRHRVHLVLQILGSIFAITGSCIMIREKSGKFKTLHSKLALAALILTSASLINGLTSLYAKELRRIISPIVSKISHTIFGVSAFALSSISLAFGYNKKSFKEWASNELALVMTILVMIVTISIIATPLSNIVSILCHEKKKKKHRKNL